MIPGYIDLTNEWDGLDLDLLLELGLGVRYAGITENGDGIAAFDIETLSELSALSIYGKVMIALDPHPDDPRTWPDWAKGVPTPSSPKRGIAVGDERFILLRPTVCSANELLRAVSSHAAVIVAYDGEPLVLVELHGDEPFVAAAEVVWDRRMVEFRDSRLVSA